MLVCSSLCQNIVLLQPFHTRKEMKITGSQVREDDGVWSNSSHRKRFRSLFVAAAVCGRVLSWIRTTPEHNIPRHLFWIKESNYSMPFTFGGRLLFRHVYGLTMRSELTAANWRYLSPYLRFQYQSSFDNFILLDYFSWLIVDEFAHDIARGLQ